MRITKLTKYTAARGDTFDKLALQLFNDELKASVIVGVNERFANVLMFEGGETLFLPTIDNGGDIDRSVAPWRR